MYLRIRMLHAGVRCIAGGSCEEEGCVREYTEYDTLAQCASRWWYTGTP
jgi:hypothetical protein